MLEICKHHYVHCDDFYLPLNFNRPFHYFFKIIDLSIWTDQNYIVTNISSSYPRFQLLIPIALQNDRCSSLYYNHVMQIHLVNMHPYSELAEVLEPIKILLLSLYVNILYGPLINTFSSLSKNICYEWIWTNPILL